MQATMTTTSLDELVRLWGGSVEPVLGFSASKVDHAFSTDQEWTINSALDFGPTVKETPIRFFEYMGPDGNNHLVGLFEENPVTQDITSSEDELVRMWGTRVRQVFPEPGSIFGQKTQIKLFEHTSADGARHRVGLIVDSEADVSHDAISSLDEFLNISDEDENSVERLESMISDVLEFALTATGKETKFFEHTGADGTVHRVGLRGKDVRQGVLVVELLGEHWQPIIHRLTAKCLANLAVTHESRIEIACLPGVLQSLLSLLRENGPTDPSVLEQTTRCLCHLAIASENRVKIASYPGMLAAFVRLLLKAGNVAVLEQTAECLTHLAESRQNQVKITSYPGALDALVRLSGECWSSRVREQAVTCLNNLSVLQESQLKIVSHPGILGTLVSLFADKETTKVQLYSIKCLNNLANHYQQNKVDISLYPGVLDALVRILRYSWITTHRLRVQEEAARCLLNLASEYRNLMKIASHPGTLDALVRCLGKYTTNKVQNLAAECLRDLAAEPGNQRKIVTHPGALAAIVRMLVQNVNPKGQEAAAWCLNKLASTQEAKIIIDSRRGVLDALVGLLDAGPGSITVQPTISCMASLALWTDKQVQIVSHPGMLDALVRLLDQDVDSSVLEQTAKCLSLLASAPENQERIVSYPGVLDALKTLLANNRTTRVLEQTAKCLTNLAECQENQVRIASFPGLLQALASLVSQSMMPSVQEETLRCFAKLSESQDNRDKITSCACDALMRLTATSTVDSSAQEQAVRCLENLSLSSAADRYPGLSSIGRQPNSMRQMRQSRQRDPSPSDPDPLYLDPMTHNIMCDPVKCTDGKTYDRWTVFPFEILMDDKHVKSGLFEAFPEQETKCNDLRRKYREEALQHAQLREYEDAEEKLNSVLKWAPSDVVCRRELERILNVLEQSIDPDRWDMDPLTYERMCDPVKCNDGRTYDRWTIIDRDLVRCPYDSNLKSFGIVVDDLNVRRRLFEEFPEQEATFRTRRARYREEALQHARNGAVNDAIRKLRNVLKWASTDRICRQELNKSLSRRTEQNFKMRFLEHDDLVRQAKREHMDQLTLPVMVLLLALGLWFIVECGWVSIEWQLPKS